LKFHAKSDERIQWSDNTNHGYVEIVHGEKIIFKMDQFAHNQKYYERGANKDLAKIELKKLVAALQDGGAKTEEVVQST
jgi:hypothetical protein